MQNKFAGLSNQDRLRKLAAMPEDEIDYSDTPNMAETTGWKKLYSDMSEDIIITDKMMFDALAKAFETESEKIPVTLNLDRKVIDFFKENSKKYQVKINEVLLAFVQTYEKSH